MRHTSLHGTLPTLVHHRLRATRDADERIALVNRLVEVLSGADEAVVAPATQLMSVLSPPGPGVLTISSRPATPLSEASLLTNATGEPSLGAELRAELDSADEVDLLCAFVKWHGLRLLEPELALARSRGIPIRVITTTYMGATERAALDRLVREFGAEVKIQYDAERTRLHAKAWMFRRRPASTPRMSARPTSRGPRCSTGSSGMSASPGRHTVAPDKFQGHVRHVLERLGSSYDPDRDRDRLDDALAEASGRTYSRPSHDHPAGLEVRPVPYQQEMLDAWPPNACP